MSQIALKKFACPIHSKGHAVLQFAVLSNITIQKTKGGGMTKPRLYGIANSRAFRSVWAAEEIGLDYEHIGTHFIDDSKAPDYLAVNPNGRIPALEDGDVRLFESMAINMYLAEKYSDGLLPQDAVARAQTWQWSIWGISEIEPLQMQIVVQKFFTPDEKKNEKVVAGAQKGLQRPLKVLDDALANHRYLLGDDFSLADLNLSSVMDLMNMIQLDVSEWSNVRRWLDDCYGRPSYASAKAKGA